MQVTVVTDKLVDRADAVGLGFERLVFGDQGGDRCLGLAAENLAHPFHAQLFHRTARFAGRPGFVGGKLGPDDAPFGLGQHRFVAQQRLHHAGLESGHGVGPGGVQSLAAMARYSFSSRFKAAMARAS